MEIPDPTESQSKLSKLIAFKTIRETLTMMGISATLVTQSFPLNGRISMGFLLLCLSITFGFMYCFNEAQTFSEYWQSIYITSSGILFAILMIILVVKAKTLFEMIDHFEDTLNLTLKYASTRPIFSAANRFEEDLSKIVYFLFVRMPVVCIAVTWSLYTFFIYLTTDLGSEAFSLPYSMWFPFNWQNPVGFLVAMAMQAALETYELIFCASIFGYAAGSFLYAIALKNIIKTTLFHLSRNTRAKVDRNVLLEQLIEFLALHLRAKQLTSNFSDIFEHFIASIFGWSLITSCGTLLVVQIEWVHGGGSLVAILVTIFEIFYTFAILFFDCEMGQRISLAFAECSEMVDQLEWYLLPTQIQRMFPTILSFAQQPFEINCFGSTRCDRNTFKIMIKTAFSYFAVLREFYD